MIFKRFLTFFVVLFSVCLMTLIFCLANLSEARFDLSENKAFDGENLDCSFTNKEAIVFNGGESKKYSPPGGGLLRLVTAVKIEENRWGKELIVKTRPCWIFICLAYAFIIFFTGLVIREIFRRRI